MEKFSLNLAVRKVARRQRIPVIEVARRTGRSMSTLRYIMLRDTPTVATCEGIASALGLTLLELIAEGYR